VRPSNMLGSIRRNLTYANVMVTILAIVVLGSGGAFALASGGTKTIKKVVLSLAPGLSVNHANHATRADSAGSADSATNAGHASSADTIPNGTINFGKLAVATATNSATAPNGALTSVTATCPAGNIPFSGSGGFTSIVLGDAQMTAAYASGNAWVVSGFNNTGSSQSLTATTYCLAP
jgi:hypothetical protein